ncbi:hypothetical protein [Pedobacter sp. JY14-1]|uniref:hypothetical protein n=1 Tax=Pedobacter sp. JY14-1 TaxID=3034151 RepID=UPI0023E165B7|nr:hypothetical protein [Pedobacter sp. JY14-1]
MRNSIFLLSLIVLAAACTKKDRIPEIHTLETGGHTATSPYLTQDHKGQIVLCWTEQDEQDSLNRLKYAVYNKAQDSFGPAVTVPGSAGCSTAAESMAKVGFKSDGTVIAIFAKRFTGEKNPYAGAICYSISGNQGRSWSPVKYIHTDTSHVFSRSFFDIARLQDGELAAVWLDGRFARSIKGSALFYARTGKGGGFMPDTCLQKGTCECCRTAMVVDKRGNLHIAYRSIQTFPLLPGKQVRDMVYQFSPDNGRHFTPAKAISDDKWEVNGCPHTGPALAVTNELANVLWFTAGGGPGLYFTSGKPDGSFKSRIMVTASGKHPQMTQSGDNQLAAVYEEPAEEEEMAAHNHSTMTSGHDHHANARIVLWSSADKEMKTQTITDGKHPDHHAVVVADGHDLLMAWVREGANGSVILYSKRKI